jgi:lysophospholipase L1-like esterase
MPEPPGPEPPQPQPQPPVVVPRLSVTRIMAFGDSMTEGEATGEPIMGADPSTPGVPRSYPFKLQTLLSSRYTEQTIQIFNGGVGGRRASDDLARLNDLLTRFQPEVLILMHGVNDLSAGIAIGPTIDAIEDLVRAAKGRGVAVLLSTLPRQRPGGFRAFAAALIVPYNLELAATAAREGVALVDIFPAITENFIATDGLHLMESGNQRLAEEYFAAIQAKFEIVPGGTAATEGRRLQTHAGRIR